MFEKNIKVSDGYHTLAAVRVAGITMSSPLWPCSTFDIPQFKYLARMTDDPDPEIISETSQPFKNRYSQYKNFVSLMELTGELAVRFDFEWFENVWSMLCVNTIGSDESMALLSVGSLINHHYKATCVPEGIDRIRMQTIRPVRKGQEITISYVNPALDFEERNFGLKVYMFKEKKATNTVVGAGDEKTAIESAKNLTKGQLKDLLQDAGLSTKGNKKTLLQRWLEQSRDEEMPQLVKSG